MAAQGSGHAIQWHYNDHSFTEELDRGTPVSFLLHLLSRTSDSHSSLSSP